MALQIGIIGLPNVGKSTLFNALTKKKIEASNYPFCTINPNVGVVAVPDERLEKIAKISKPKQIIPTTIEFVDIAGLVKGAHKGEGLGNQFLSHIRECDAICEVIRNFNNNDIIHVEGTINPERDREIIDLELIFADLQSINKQLEKINKEAKSGSKEILKRKELMERIRNNLDKGSPARSLSFSEEEKNIIKNFGLLTLKPLIYIINTDKKLDVKNNEIALNVKQEEEIASLPLEEQKEFIKELGMEQSGLHKLIQTSYKILGLLTFFTTGSDETRAWTVKSGARAPEAAGKIHTDFKKGFIRAEIISWKDFIKVGGELSAREKGLIRTEGKNYLIQDGDICHFLHN